MADERLDVLAIAPHPDDAELTCGGALIKCADQGYRTGVLEMTGGESGTRGSRRQRLEEAGRAAEIMGLAVRENLGLPDAGLEDSQENRLVLARAIRRLGPRVVLLPSWRGRHPDHAVTARLARAAAFLAGLKKIGGEGTVARPEKLVTCLAFIEHAGKPSFVIDISEQFERKIKAVMCYRSQFEGRTEAGELFPNGEQLEELVRTQCGHYGSLIRKRYGEPFHVRETIEVEDLPGMGVKSI